jgi:hypothetical protein
MDPDNSRCGDLIPLGIAWILIVVPVMTVHDFIESRMSVHF